MSTGLPRVSSTFQELGILPTLVLFYFWADFGIDYGMVLCHVYGMFCGLNCEDIVAGGKGLFRDGFESKWPVPELQRSSLARNCVVLHLFKPPTLDAHIFLVWTLIRTFLDSMERYLSLESDHIHVNGILCSYMY